MCVALYPADPNFWSKVDIFSGKQHSVVQPSRNYTGVHQFNDSEISQTMTVTHITKQPADSDNFDEVMQHSKQQVQTEKTNISNHGISPPPPPPSHPPQDRTQQETQQIYTQTIPPPPPPQITLASSSLRLNRPSPKSGAIPHLDQMPYYQ